MSHAAGLSNSTTHPTADCHIAGTPPGAKPRWLPRIRYVVSHLSDYSSRACHEGKIERGVGEVQLFRPSRLRASSMQAVSLAYDMVASSISLFAASLPGEHMEAKPVAGLMLMAVFKGSFESIEAVHHVGRG